MVLEMFTDRRIKRKEARINELEEKIAELVTERDCLMERNHQLSVAKTTVEHELTEKYEALEKKKKREEEDIAHHLKMREEQIVMEKDKAIQKEKEKCAEKVRTVKEEYATKYEEQLQARGDELRDMYKEVLERLPNVSMAMRHDTKVRAAAEG